MRQFTRALSPVLYKKSEQIYAVLNSFNGNHLSDYEFREWLIFKTVSREKSFGFTIGGFAQMSKTTFTSVSYPQLKEHDKLFIK